MEIVNYHINLLEKEQDILDLKNMFAENLDKKSGKKIYIAIERALGNTVGSEPEFLRLLELGERHDILIHLIHPNGDILSLPWQILIENHPFVHISKGSRPLTMIAEPAAFPLKILLFFSNPIDSELDQLKVNDEIRFLLSAFSSFTTEQLDLDIVDDGSLQALESEISKKEYDVIYFSGHGVYEKNDTQLLLEESLTGKLHKVTGLEFASTILNMSKVMPKLFVLSSCNTSLGDVQSDRMGITQRLLDIGVPSVISFGYNVSETYATDFFFYLVHNLIAGYDLVTSFKYGAFSIKHGNQSIDGRPYESDYQWITPQLFLSKKVEHLIDWQAKPNGTKREAQTLLESKAYYPFTHREQVIKIVNAIDSTDKVQISGHSMLGKSHCLSYCLFKYNRTINNISHLMILEDEFTFEQFSSKVADLLKIEKNLDEQAIKKALTEYAVNKKLIITIDHIEKYLKLSDDGFCLVGDQKNLLSFIQGLEGVSVIVECRHPIGTIEKHKIIEFNDFSIPVLSFILKKHFFGAYVESAFNRRKEISYYSNSPLDYLVKRLYLGYDFGGIVGLYALFEILIKSDAKNIKFDHENEFIAAYDEFINKALSAYKHGFENFFRGYDIVAILRSLLDLHQQVLLGLTLFEAPVREQALIDQEIITEYDTFELKWLVDRQLLLTYEELNDEKGKEHYFHVHPLVKSIKIVAENNSFSYEKAGRYFEEHYNTHLREPVHDQIKNLTKACEFYEQFGDIKSYSELAANLCHLHHTLNQTNDVHRVANRVYQKLENKTPSKIFKYLFIAVRDNDVLLSEKYVQLYREAIAKNFYILDEIECIGFDALIDLKRGDFLSSEAKFNKALRKLDSCIGSEDFEDLRLSIMHDSTACLRQLGKFTLAIERLNLCLDKAKEKGIDSSNQLTNLAQVYEEVGDVSMAKRCCREALEQARKFRNSAVEIVTLILQARFLTKEFDFINARLQLQHADMRASVFNDVYRKAIISAHLGLTYLLEADSLRNDDLALSIYQKAEPYFQTAFDFYKKNDMIRDECSVRASMSKCCEKLGRIDECINHLNTALDISIQYNIYDLQFSTISNLAVFHARYGNLEEARKRLFGGLDKIDELLTQEWIDSRFARKMNSEKINMILQLAELKYLDKDHEEYLRIIREAWKLFLKTDVIFGTTGAEQQFYGSAKKYTMEYPKDIFSNELKPFLDKLEGKLI
ncbi:MAG: CHAT domain-containing protein [Cyclobacteriaceae bacterium]